MIYVHRKYLMNEGGKGFWILTMWFYKKNKTSRLECELKRLSRMQTSFFPSNSHKGFIWRTSENSPPAESSLKFDRLTFLWSRRKEGSIENKHFETKAELFMSEIVGLVMSNCVSYLMSG